jgi:hypothetical protein
MGIAQGGEKRLGEVNAARRSLLKLVPEYTLQFVTLTAKHGACSSGCAEQLLRTAKMKALIDKYCWRITNLLASLPPGSEVSPCLHRRPDPVAARAAA